MKQRVRINEAQLRRIISESIRNTILEYDNGSFCTDQDMIRFNIIGHFSSVIGKVERWINDACENKMGPNSIEERALSCIKKVDSYFHQAYEEGRERGLLMEAGFDYRDNTPPDTRSKDEKVASHMRYLRGVMENEKNAIIRICKSSKMNLKELGQFGISIFSGMLGILDEYGF